MRKRDNFRRAFKDFDPAKVARFGERDIERLLGDQGIVRHRGKIEGAIASAKATLVLDKEGGLSKFLWDYVDGEPIQNAFAARGKIPAETPLSKEISKALKARGFAFCGPTIVYAFMQAVGMVNDHVVTCFRHDELLPKRPTKSKALKRGRPSGS